MKFAVVLSTVISFSAATVILPRAPVLNDVLNEHNSFRAKHGAAALKWSDTLANAAQSWANRCVFEHSGGAVGPYGENLAAGAGGGWNALSGVKGWENEASDYNPNSPQPSHFTQMVWKGSKELGCATANCGTKIFGSGFPAATFLVCEYSPAGNVIGQFPQNVQK
ncbi:hypothetical protein V5O48_015279 [Marasmius crinis-equi]|uniref:SCP domain-containing protein n=1 Tax=Marasmius crinis-equi TaxID=585013 RepID=A0ABR3EUY6_9AGAR